VDVILCFIFFLGRDVEVKPTVLPVYLILLVN